jgi:hypothetical protein
MGSYAGAATIRFRGVEAPAVVNLVSHAEPNARETWHGTLDTDADLWDAFFDRENLEIELRNGRVGNAFISRLSGIPARFDIEITGTGPAPF